MKKLLSLFCVFVITLHLFAQQGTTRATLTKDDYLKMSKNQKKAGWFLVGGGAALIVTGIAIGDGDNATFDDAASGGIIAVVGIASALGSIPLFIASGRNKRKAMNMTMNFDIHRTSIASQVGWSHVATPGIAIKINF